MKKVHIASQDKHVAIGGCRLPKHAPVGLKLKDFLHAGAAYPSSPVSVDYSPKALSVITNIEGNDALGDCHDAKTEVLTESGWTKWADYDTERRLPLATMNQATGMLEYQAPIALKRRTHNGPMAFSSHKRLNFALTPNHRMLVKPYFIPKPYVKGTSGYGPQRFAAISDLPARCLIPGSPTGFLGTTLKQLAIGRRVWDGTDLLRLLAVITSDGYVRSGPNKNVVSFCCFDEHRRSAVADLAYRLGIGEQPSRRGVWSFTDANLAEWLRKNAYTSDSHRAPFKRVPTLVKVADAEQIREFLQFFGDQRHDRAEGEGRTFSTTSHQMADDLQELLLKTGRRASIYERELRMGGKNARGEDIVGNYPEIVVYENEVGDISLLKGSKRNPSIEWDHYSGEVFCATVPNSTLITRREGKVLISGNCVFAEDAHYIGVMTGNANTLYSYTVAQTVADYSAVTGYNPADPSTDQGADPITSMNYRVARGYADGSKDAGWALVDGSNWAEVQYAINTFGNLKMWFGIPDSIVQSMPQSSGFVWDVSAGAPDMQNGHCIGSPGYNPATVTQQGAMVMTWGMLGVVTKEALASWFVPSAGGGLAVRVTTDWVSKASGATPSGLNLSALITAFNLYFGGSLIVPAPPTPPVPPAPPLPLPPTPAGGVTLAQAQAWLHAGFATAHPLLTRHQAESIGDAALMAKWPTS